jgi:hypothetical protein
MPQPRHDEPVLAIAVRGLVHVHEIHVNRAPRESRLYWVCRWQIGLRSCLRPLIHIFDGENV